jgi:phosphatidylglycerophosphate synthase
MIDNGVLWVSHPALMLERVGGMSVIERQLFTAARAGLKRLWVAAAPPGEKALSRMRLPPGLELHWIDKDSDAPADCQPPYLGLSGEHFIKVDALRQTARWDDSDPAALHDEEGATVIQVMPTRLDRFAACQKQPLPEGSCVRVERPLSNGPALPWLLGTGPKASDGFMARHFDRAISLAVSRLLLDTPVTPNMMTVLSSLIGVIGAAFFLKHDWASGMTGAILIWLHSVLDGCDGELARIRFQESPFGAAIDFWGDNLVHLCLFGGLAWGFFRADDSLVPLALGAAAATGTLGSACLAYWQKLQGHGPVAGTLRREDGPLARLETVLAQRDFIYLLLLLAYIGRTYEFLWAAAVGSMIFFAMMSYSAAPRRFQREQA